MVILKKILDVVLPSGVIIAILSGAMSYGKHNKQIEYNEKQTIEVKDDLKEEIKDRKDMDYKHAILIQKSITQIEGISKIIDRRLNE